MPRPRKRRDVCCLPENNRFGPLGYPNNPNGFVNMTIDEYETIRLLDIEGLTQEECALQMNVSRTTIQAIYNDARNKLAQSLVYGKILLIEGGDYQICHDMGNGFRGRRCHKHRRNIDQQIIDEKGD